jgi:hypothetical protein
MLGGGSGEYGMAFLRWASDTGPAMAIEFYPRNRVSLNLVAPNGSNRYREITGDAMHVCGTLFVMMSQLAQTHDKRFTDKRALYWREPFFTDNW